MLPPFRNALGQQVSRLYLPPIKLDGWIVTRPRPPLVSLWCRFQDGCAVRCAIPSPRWNRVSSNLYRTRTAQTRQHTFTKGALRVWVESRHPLCRSAFFLRAGKGILLIFRGSLSCIKECPLQACSVDAARVWRLRRRLGHHREMSIPACVERRMADAFDPDAAFSCPAHHPHLRMTEASWLQGERESDSAWVFQ